MGKHALYLLLVRTNTRYSRLLKACTGMEYTHVSLALDRDFRALYTFGRRFSSLMLPAGFVKESLKKRVYRKNGQAPAMVLRLDVSEAGYSCVRAAIRHYRRHAWRYRYNVLGLPLMALNIPWARSRHWVCSQFTARMLALSGAATLPRPWTLMRPTDFLKVPELKILYRGPLCDCAPWPEEQAGQFLPELAR